MVQQPTRSAVGQLVPGVPPFDMHDWSTIEVSDDGTVMSVHSLDPDMSQETFDIPAPPLLLPDPELEPPELDPEPDPELDPDPEPDPEPDPDAH